MSVHSPPAEVNLQQIKEKSPLTSSALSVLFPGDEKELGIDVRGESFSLGIKEKEDGNSVIFSTWVKMGHRYCRPAPCYHGFASQPPSKRPCCRLQSAVDPDTRRRRSLCAPLVPHRRTSSQHWSWCFLSFHPKRINNIESNRSRHVGCLSEKTIHGRSTVQPNHTRSIDLARAHRTGVIRTQISEQRRRRRISDEREWERDELTSWVPRRSQESDTKGRCKGPREWYEHPRRTRRWMESAKRSEVLPWQCNKVKPVDSWDRAIHNQEHVDDSADRPSTLLRIPFYPVS